MILFTFLYVLNFICLFQISSSSSPSSKQDWSLVPVVKTERIPKIENLLKTVDDDKKVSEMC